MMAELALLAALRDRLTSAGLAPTPSLIGFAEPEVPGALPALVISLEDSTTAGTGLGGRTRAMTGALATQATIDLAHPVLPAEPTFVLIDDARKVLTLPHGGLVKSNGTAGPIAAGDATVTVGATARSVVTGTPTGQQVKIDGAIGQLTFATALPATGPVKVTYFLGQWEQRVEHIGGTVRIDVCGGTVSEVDTLTPAVLDALGPGAVAGLAVLALKAVSAIGPAEVDQANLHRRTLRFRFDYERLIDRADSSGGIIARIPIVTSLSSLTVEARTGDIDEVIVTEAP